LGLREQTSEGQEESVRTGYKLAMKLLKFRTGCFEAMSPIKSPTFPLLGCGDPNLINGFEWLKGRVSLTIFLTYSIYFDFKISLFLKVIF
jgi:hypothetical protein